MRGWTAQLRLEDGQRAAHIVAADVHRAACFGKPDQRYQNMLQTKRQQQALTGTKNHRAKVTRAVNNMTNTGNAQGKDRPYQRDHQAKQAHHHRGNDRHKTGTAEKGQRIR
ncbi:hypothetical protein D3C78_1186420 [compost metagenome]